MVEPLVPMIVVGLIFVTLIGGTLTMGVIFVLMIRMLIGSERRPTTEAAMTSEREDLEARVLGMRPTLRAWHPEALTALSTEWHAGWSRVGRRFAAHGTLLGVNEDGPLVAFALRLHGFLQPEGQMVAQTTAQSFHYRVTPAAITISVDGTPLGMVLPDGTLLSPAEVPIGSALRPEGVPIAVEIGPFQASHDPRATHAPVTLNERIIGALTNPRFRPFHIRGLLTGQERQPAITTSAAPSPDEATWLLALAILRVVLDGFRISVQ